MVLVLALVYSIYGLVWAAFLEEMSEACSAHRLVIFHLHIYIILYIATTEQEDRIREEKGREQKG